MGHSTSKDGGREIARTLREMAGHEGRVRLAKARLLDAQRNLEEAAAAVIGAQRAVDDLYREMARAADVYCQHAQIETGEAA